jgi:hypothetical protein
MMVMPASGTPGEAGPERHRGDGHNDDGDADHGRNSKPAVAPSEPLPLQLFD